MYVKSATPREHKNPSARVQFRGQCIDCRRQVVIRLIVTPEGFPLSYKVLAGNTALGDFLKRIEAHTFATFLACCLHITLKRFS